MFKGTRAYFLPPVIEAKNSSMSPFKKRVPCVYFSAKTLAVGLVRGTKHQPGQSNYTN